jgi:putative phosphoribosyl transferase
MTAATAIEPRTRLITLPVGQRSLVGELGIPASPTGMVLFVHGSGSSRASPRNRAVAGMLQRAGLATLRFDLLTSREAEEDAVSHSLRFDLTLLSRRLTRVVDLVAGGGADGELPIGLFGANTGAAAALITAAERPALVRAVVSHGGRGDLAGAALARVHAPTLLIVGGDDREVLTLNHAVLRALSCEKALEIVPGVTHRFDEAGALETAARLARAWFITHLRHDAAALAEASPPG